MRKARAKPQLLSKKLRIIRRHLHLTQPKMAQLLQLKFQRVSDYENGRRLPSTETVLAYAYAGKVRMDFIIDDEISVASFRTLLGTFDYVRIGIKVVQIQNEH